MENQTDLLQPELTSKFKRRRELLPWWIKVFTWIFLLLGLVVPVAFIFGVLGYKFQIAIYGFYTTDPLSLVGIFQMALLFFKSVVAYSLWTENDLAIRLGIIDAIVGIIICILTIGLLPYLFLNQPLILNLNFELLFLTPYLIKLKKIRLDWHMLGIKYQ